MGNKNQKRVFAPPFTISKKMLNLVVEITEQLARLKVKKTKDLHLRKENRLRSIHSSLAIEQNSLTIAQVTDIINGKKVLGPPSEIKEVKNAYKAYESVFKLNPYSKTDFLKTHKLLTTSLIKDSGEFRSGDVGVYDSKGNIVHMGARPQYVSQLISDLFNWAKKDVTHDLIKSSIVHFEIEMIHPFQDGNGRMGRLWQNLILSKWQQIFEWIPVETIVYKNQREYYTVLAESEKSNDSSIFIEFMLEAIRDTIAQFEASIKKDGLGGIIDNQVQDKISEKELLFFSQIYEHLKVHHEIRNRKAVELTQKPSVTVRRYLIKFVDLGILISSGENRNRSYRLSKRKHKK